MENEAQQLLNKAVELHKTGFSTGDASHHTQALTLIRQAAALQLPEAIHQLADYYTRGFLVEQDHIQALSHLYEAAGLFHLPSYCEIARFHDEGLAGLTASKAKGAEWDFKAAEAGSATGQYNMGYRCTYGHGVEKNLYEAIRWYSRAAEQEPVSSDSHRKLNYIIGILMLNQAA